MKTFSKKNLYIVTLSQENLVETHSINHRLASSPIPLSNITKANLIWKLTTTRQLGTLKRKVQRFLGIVAREQANKSTSVGNQENKIHKVLSISIPVRKI